MAKRIYSVESIMQTISTVPSKTVTGSYEKSPVWQVGFRLDDPTAKDVLLDGNLNIVAFEKKSIENFILGKKVTIEVIDNP